MEVCSRHIYDEPTNDDLIGFDHRLGEKLGQGSYGIIFEGTNATTNKSVAIKFESCNAEIPQLQREYNVYLDLHGLKGIPNIYYFGMEGDDYCMIMDLLGPSLEDLFEMCGKRFSIKTVACVGKEMVSLIQSVHERHYIYRDIKPDNFLIGDPNDHLTKNHLHLIDFGMSKRYRDPTTHRHYPYKECKSLTGTARYMSINTHLGKEQSRRDDLESLCHVLFYFLRGSLPWQGLKASSQKERYMKICENKQNMDPFILCDDFPEQFATLLKYARSLRFDETPDYDYCRELLDNVLTEIDEVDDGIRDWMLINNGRGWEVNGRKRPKKQLLLMPY